MKTLIYLLISTTRIFDNKIMFQGYTHVVTKHVCYLCTFRCACQSFKS